MNYLAYQAFANVLGPVRAMARATSDILQRPWPGAAGESFTQRLAATCEIIARLALTHTAPKFGIESVMVDGREVVVSEEVVDLTPFCRLLHFRKDGPTNQPPALIVAPLSGHFATLLRGTVRSMLRDHDVYITDWINVRDVSLLAGRFDLDECVLHLVRFLDRLGADANVVAVCQSTIPALAAVALMAADKSPNQPRTLTLMAGPIDTRINPTLVNELATTKPIEWFERHLIGTVPFCHRGALRRVYPGFVQIAAFMSMNLERHADSFVDLYRHRVGNDEAKADDIRRFYEEYFATMDLPAEFYLQTVRSVFQEHQLPLGTLAVRGQRVAPQALRRTALLTIEGENDDICSVGQTLAAQDLCSGIRPYRKRHHVQTGVGHYGVFNGRRWDREIYPMVRDFIHLGA